MGKLKKVSRRAPEPITAAGYGDRIRRALALRQVRTGERRTLEQVGETIARLIGRATDFSAGTVSGWLEERSEPPLAVFLALGSWTGAGASAIAFGPEGRRRASDLRGAEDTPPDYYNRLDVDDEGERGSA